MADRHFQFTPKNKKELNAKIKEVLASPVSAHIDQRLKEFKAVQSKSEKDWWFEMCFCLLTANAKSQTAMNVQKALGYKGFAHSSFETIRDAILENKHRFHNIKAQRIIDARQHFNIKTQIQTMLKTNTVFEVRDYLAQHIKGFGFKEASHYLRNIGYFDCAILDRHILYLLHTAGYIEELPKSLTKKKYYDIEKTILNIAKHHKINPAKLDFVLWYLRAGGVLK